MLTTKSGMIAIGSGMPVATMSTTGGDYSIDIGHGAMEGGGDRRRKHGIGCQSIKNCKCSRVPS